MGELYSAVDLTPFSVEVACSRLRAFSRVTGEDDPAYSDVTAAQAAGYPSLPVPPTFLFCLEMEGPKPMEMYERIGIDYSHVLHGEQHFRYYRMAFAGETSALRAAHHRSVSKEGRQPEVPGAETRVEGDDGTAVADLRSVYVVRDPRQGTLE